MANAKKDSSDQKIHVQGQEEASSSTQHSEYDQKAGFVLRQVRLKNFVKFQEEQELSFEENGAYYLIGVNQSGKSSIFESIRRCLCLDCNSSISNVPDPSRDSIVVCRFEDGNNNSLISVYIRQAKKENTFIKGCVITDQYEQIIKYGIDHIEVKDDRFVVIESDNEVIPETKLFEKDAINDRDWLDQLIFWTERVNSKNSCEDLLSKHLDGVVFTLPMRGIGALQWTRSKKIKCKENNYNEANDRAEIIRQYLVKKQHMKKEQDIYNIITNNKGGIYTLKSDCKSIVVNEHLPILKQSEGFLEAKICSILLTEKTITTIGLEDPGTGMHVQMVERLRNAMTFMVKDKVVIVSTHSPSFIKPELMGNMFFLSRDKEGKCEVISGKKLSCDKQLRSVIPGSVSADQFATICFAEMTVFVEGASDIQFMEAFTTFMRNKGKPYCDFHFVSMGGAKKIQYFRKCCRALQKGHCFILDKDVEEEVKTIFKKERQKEIDLAKQPGTERIFQEEENVFFWDFQNLEDLFFKGILTTFKETSVVVSESELKEILQRIVKGKCDLTFTDDDLIEAMEIKSAGKFKIFLHGEDTFDDRIKLFEYLMGDCDINKAFKSSRAGLDLEKLCDFLERFTQ